MAPVEPHVGCELQGGVAGVTPGWHHVTPSPAPSRDAATQHGPFPFPRLSSSH